MAPAAWDKIDAGQAIQTTGDKPFGLIFGTLAQRDPVSRSAIRALWEKADRHFYDVNLRPPFTTRELVMESLQATEVVKVNAAELTQILSWVGITPADRSRKATAKAAQDLASLINSLVVCFFAGMGLQPLHHMVLLNTVTGAGYTTKELLLIGERISNLQRAFNLRCGITAVDDKLPPRLLEPTPDGGAAGRVPDIKFQLEEYYQVRGWDAKGIPTKQKLQELGLEEVIKDLY